MTRSDRLPPPGDPRWFGWAFVATRRSLSGAFCLAGPLLG